MSYTIFSVTALLTTYLNLKIGEEHPLPWYPPFCTPFVNSMPNLHLLCCDHLLGVQRAKGRSRRDLMPEAQLRNDFLKLINVSSSSEAEIGQRIFTMLKQNIGPKWLLYNLAALYWRIIGITVEAVACLRLALAEKNGIPYADVALFQLSYLSYVAGGRLDDAVSLIHQAIEIDNTEPLPQYLLGYYLVLKSNWTGAVHHLRSCLQADPRFTKASKLFAYARCMQFATFFPNSHLRHLRECSQRFIYELFCGEVNISCYIEYFFTICLLWIMNYRKCFLINSLT
ncbi:unnamed protein product [Soboliphyme baturini]|uniref:TPR_REGION domain-containing protein n=1 Tax=Soboliphyme baturini TaxID=241478 RepID=A0A183J9E3_9BILA|nr:unnamed protein product [Soboliphyme baturini]